MSIFNKKAGWNMTEKLVAFWSSREKDFVVKYPRREDGALVFSVFSGKQPHIDLSSKSKIVFDKSFIEELTDRGYDLTTLRFSIKKLEE